jgi:membrane associated rhomboid family serine protease
MITVTCPCGWQWSRPERAPSLTRRCPYCRTQLTLACAERLPQGAADGDFDAYLQIVAGPTRVGERIFLGGVTDIPVGRLDGICVHLAGAKVSRHHANLARVDFGPSRWSIADNDSAHGLALNDHQVTFRELKDGDVITLGDYQLRFGHTGAAAQASPAADGEGTAPCPSCRRDLPASAHACISCGIRLPSGRPLLLLSRDYKQEIEQGRAVPWLTPLTWLIWLTPLPIPLLSEASGTRQPWAIRLIAAVTTIASVAFLLLALSTHRILDTPGKNFMLWPPGVSAADFRVRISAPEARRVIAEMNEDELDQLRAARERIRGSVPDDQLDRRALEDLANTYLAPKLGEPGHYEPYQLVTYAFLHDKSSLWGCALHLGSNLVFLVVFGSRINAVLGNLATLILYPLLAVGAALVHLHFAHPTGPLLGASGAINGLAGMYLVLFPLHRVYCAMWVRFRIWCAMRIFVARGFWILLLYFAIDATTAYFQARGGDNSGGVAHFAHVGGFLTGVALAFGILLSRAVYCGGGDVLSVTLGRFAWPLVGRPSRRRPPPAA